MRIGNFPREAKAFRRAFWGEGLSPSEGVWGASSPPSGFGAEPQELAERFALTINRDANYGYII
ncbi:hypothetical protein FACS1894219_00450 [Clostridia bacterium]|nr:hypothetical protein FACS1894219_00450 [Clostridia bacterium]